ncbi:MAG TPA: cytochrome C [Coleofasciculaceae cyanobacterium]
MSSRFRFPVRVNHLRKFRRPLVLVLLVCWSILLGWGLAQAQTPSANPSAAPSAPAAPYTPPVGTVDPVPERYQLGQELYLENCATCHVGLPPAVMPSQTWAQILPDSQHYGVQVNALTEPSLQLVWSYVSNYSRPILPNEQVPYRLRQSRYFKALHPKVEFPQPITVQSCVTCHPAAAQFNYRSLTPEWQQSP